MKVINIIDSVDESMGGTVFFLQNYSNKVSSIIDFSILCKSSKNPLCFNKSTNFINFNSFNFKDFINLKPDLMHFHGIWSPFFHRLIKFSCKASIPYIISPHGMLEPWTLEYHKYKKKLALLIYQYKDLRNSKCIHATSEAEADHLRKLGLKNPISIIPIGINVDEVDSARNILETKSTKDKKTLLFLSRIHPKKGIENLIEAFSRIDSRITSDWVVNIIGDGDLNYINSLKNMIKDKNLVNHFSFCGPKYGTEKFYAYLNADLFVLPTYSENFGIVIAEALASEVPVITTKGTPWQELEKFNAGWWIDIGIDSLIRTLQEALSLSRCELKDKGRCGRGLIIEKYSDQVMTSKFLLLYEWLKMGGETPNFVNKI